MIKTFLNQSGKISELRETVDLCGKKYSIEFFRAVYGNDEKNVRSYSYTNNQVASVFRQEFIKVAKSESGELSWKAIDRLPVCESEFAVETSLGLFRSEDRGEFGGMLITPAGTLGGNFRNLFEFGGKVYAIDSLSHMGLARTCIYEFDEKVNDSKLFETSHRELMSLASIEIEDSRILILVSGEILGENGTLGNGAPGSYLFEISGDGFKKLAEFDFDFHYVYNMFMIGKELIVGMDKVVAFANTETKEIGFVTPLTVEAENDIRKVIG